MSNTSERMFNNNKSILEQFDFNKINRDDVRDALSVIDWYELLDDMPTQRCYDVFLSTIGDICGVLC